MTLQKLAPTVGAEVLGVDAERLLDDETLPARTLEALDAHGVLVFRDLHLDDATQVAFSKRLGRVEVFGKGEHPEIFRVTLDPAKNKAAGYLRGTFDWHIDGLTEDVLIMATLLSAHDVATQAARPSSPAPTPPTTTSPTMSRSGSWACGSSHAGGDAALVNPDPTPEEVRGLAPASAQGTPAGVDAPVGPPLARPRRHDRECGRDGPRRGPGLDDLLDRATAPEHVYRHEWAVGDLVIWDNTGVLHRALPTTPPPPDMHRTTLYGQEAVQ